MDGMGIDPLPEKRCGMDFKDNDQDHKQGEAPSDNAPERRLFLQGATAVMAMLALGKLGQALPSPKFLRPPGGQDEKSFLSKCLRCDRCRSACPTSVIGVVHTEESSLSARTPAMLFHLGYCTFCKRCVEVCPTGALQPFEVKSVKIGLATITDRCIAWNYGGCTVCQNACTYHAIRLDALRRPIVDRSKCNGCGICEKVCPALVMRSYAGGTTRGIEVRPVVNAGGLR